MDKIILPKPNAEQRQLIVENTFKDFTAWLEQNHLPTPNYQELRQLYFSLAFNQFQQVKQQQQTQKVNMLLAHEQELLAVIAKKTEDAAAEKKRIEGEKTPAPEPVAAANGESGAPKEVIQ